MDDACVPLKEEARHQVPGTIKTLKLQEEAFTIEFLRLGVLTQEGSLEEASAELALVLLRCFGLIW